MQKTILIILQLLIIQMGCFAQDMPNIQTDRPDQTECPFITPQHYFQVENGFLYENNTQNSELIVAPTILTRFGMNKYFELRLITEFVISNEESTTYAGINPILIGFKVRLLEEKGIIPSTSLIAHVGFPEVASSGYRANYYYPEIRFTMQHTISDKQSLSYNLGAEWDGLNTNATFIYTLSTGYALSETIGAYVEFYGYLPQSEKGDHRFDFGLTYLFNPNNQFDLSGGFGLSAISPNYYVAIGYSFRFKI